MYVRPYVRKVHTYNAFLPSVLSTDDIFFFSILSALSRFPVDPLLQPPTLHSVPSI